MAIRQWGRRAGGVQGDTNREIHPDWGREGERRGKRLSGLWTGEWEPMMLCSETGKGRSECGSRWGEGWVRHILNTLSSECRQNMQEVAGNMCLVLFSLTSSLMNKCELSDPELYPWWPNIDKVPSQRSAFQI